MKNYLIFTLIILLQFIIFSCTTSIDEDEEKGNILFVLGHLTYKGENYTGEYTMKWPKEWANKQPILLKYKFKNGLPDGPQEIYHDNGRVYKTFDNFDGEKYGTVTIYNYDGTLIWDDKARGSKSKWVGFFKTAVRGISTARSRNSEALRQALINRNR